MTEYHIERIFENDQFRRKDLQELVKKAGIQLDKNLDYTCGAVDEEGKLVATGSLYQNTLRCLAVLPEYQGEGLLNLIVTHLIETETSRGNFHLFVYTKPKAAKFFKQLGFYEIAANSQLVFLENERTGFSDYLADLAAASPAPAPKTAGIVMNANPFTLGHQYLVQQAAENNDLVHLFVVSEDSSFFAFKDRYQLIKDGVSQWSNVILHETGPYLISSATFPSYFQPDDDSVIQSEAGTDAQIFGQIAEKLGITKRYVGTEPFSHVTQLYNQELRQVLEPMVELVEVPRLSLDDQAVSASKVRELLKADKLAEAEKLLPKATCDFLQTAPGQAVIEKLKQSDSVVHY